ncbi:MAG: hypothetical protein KDD34_07440, partial [Bdellovibrionales bacterium]|nr:hypothetical protein [Bdellovibrionales bacterium]
MEISSTPDGNGPAFSQRYYLPKIPLEKAIADFWQTAKIGDINKIVLSLKASKTVLKKRLGSSPALIVTEGFEHWLDMNLPIVNESFTQHPARSPSPLSEHLLFGLQERISSSGEVLKEISDEELTFLASKLEMSRAKTVAICLLHSQKNPIHEKKVKEFFTQKGFEVYCSSDSPTNHTERLRWLRPVLDGYLASSFKDQLNTFINIPELNLHQEKIFVATGEGLSPIHQTPVLPSLLGDVFLLQNGNRHHNQPYYFWGIDDFIYFPNANDIQNVFETDLGPVSLKSPKHCNLSLAPTSRFETDFWGIGAINSSLAGYEPGPICFGRGLQLTFFDLLFVHEWLQEISPLNQLLKPDSKNRIFDNLSSLNKEAGKELLNKDLL